MNIDEKLEKQIALVKKFYPDRDSLWCFFNTLKDNSFLLSCVKDSSIDKKTNQYLRGREFDSYEWMYTWELFAMIEYVSKRSGSYEKEKFHEFEEQFKNI
jgi:hypothetical protein